MYDEKNKNISYYDIKNMFENKYKEEGVLQEELIQYLNKILKDEEFRIIEIEPSYFNYSHVAITYSFDLVENFSIDDMPYVFWSQEEKFSDVIEEIKIRISNFKKRNAGYCGGKYEKFMKDLLKLCKEHNMGIETDDTSIVFVDLELDQIVFYDVEIYTCGKFEIVGQIRHPEDIILGESCIEISEDDLNV